MFRDIYSVDMELKVGRRHIKAFAVKANVLGSEVLLVTRKGEERHMLCEMPDALRALVLELNALNRVEEL